MRKVEDIEREIGEIANSEFGERQDCVIQQHETAWDLENQADFGSPKLDKLLKASNADCPSGHARQV